MASRVEHLERASAALETVMRTQSLAKPLTMNEVVASTTEVGGVGFSIGTLRTMLLEWNRRGLVDISDVKTKTNSTMFVYRWIGADDAKVPDVPARIADWLPRTEVAVVKPKPVAKPEPKPVKVNGNGAHSPAIKDSTEHRNIHFVLNDKTGAIGVRVGENTTLWLNILSE